MLKAVANSNIYCVDTRPLHRLSNEINKIGVNINQIAKIANTNGNIYKNEISYLQEKIELMEVMMSEIFQKIKTIKGG